MYVTVLCHYSAEEMMGSIQGAHRPCWNKRETLKDESRKAESRRKFFAWLGEEGCSDEEVRGGVLCRRMEARLGGTCVCLNQGCFERSRTSVSLDGYDECDERAYVY